VARRNHQEFLVMCFTLNKIDFTASPAVHKMGESAQTLP
jgi:hypothetical protein